MLAVVCSVFIRPTSESFKAVGQPRTADAVRRQSEFIGRVSAERIQQELTRILLEALKPGDALETLSSLGLLKEILPEVEATRGQEQPPQFHPEGDVWTHTVLMLNAMNSPSLRLATHGAWLAYSVLLHDVGKPATAVKAPDRIRFNRHAAFGADMAAVILKRLRLPSADIKAISHIIGNHMRFMDVRRMRKSTLRRLITADTFQDELELHRLDCEASHGGWQHEQSQEPGHLQPAIAQSDEGDQSCDCKPPSNPGPPVDKRPGDHRSGAGAAGEVQHFQPEG